MPGQQNTILFEMKGAAAGALGADSPSGVNTDAAKDGTNMEQSSFFKKMKNVPKQIASFSKSSLGVQFSLAAMLRQSQIATGFLSAMFQVLGAIVDSFLVAFAPTLFSAIAGMSKLIPVARATGYAIVDSVHAVRERIWEFMNWTLPILKWIGKGVLGVVKFVMGLPKIVLGLALAGLLLGKLLAHFKVKHYTVMYQVNFKSTLKALSVHSARSGGKGGGGGAGGLLAMVGGINPIVVAIMTVAAVAAPLIMGFLGRDKGSRQGVDVAGQLGKEYLPSQASKLGTDLNTLMSSGFEETFVGVNASLLPGVDAITGGFGVAGTAAGTLAANITKASQDIMKIRQLVADALADHLSKPPPPPPLPPLPTPPAMPRNRTSIDGGAYTGIGSGATSKEVTREIERAGRDWAIERGKMTKMQIDHERQMNAIKVNEANNTMLAMQAIWNRTIDEGID